MKLKGEFSPCSAGFKKHSISFLKSGGCIPGCDHGIPADVSWPNFVLHKTAGQGYGMVMKKEIFLCHKIFLRPLLLCLFPIFSFPFSSLSATKILQIR
jgi:hypothetical protein